MSKSFFRLEWRRLVTDGPVIIISILLAFAINTWWAARGDRAEEREYLTLLKSDLNNTLGSIAEFGGKEDSIDWAKARLVQAFYEPKLPSEDSLAHWSTVAASAWVVQAYLGTAEFLVNTGKIRLIRDDSLRLALPRYLNLMKTFVGFEDRLSESRWDLQLELEKEWGYNLNYWNVEYQDPQVRDSSFRDNNLYPYPSGDLRRIPKPDFEALVRNPRLHSLLTDMNGMTSQYRFYREQMRKQTEDVLSRVQRVSAGPT